MEIKFECLERPVKVRQRTYSPEQLDFMKKKCHELLNVGYIHQNPSSKWACAPLMFPKDGPEGFRFTVDLRPANAQTKKHVWPMPHADPMLAKLAGGSIFFKLYFIHGYWQFPLRRELARMPVVSHAFRCLHTESSPAWCNEFRFLFPINHGIAVLSSRSAHLAGRYAGLRLGPTALWRR